MDESCIPPVPSAMINPFDSSSAADPVTTPPANAQRPHATAEAAATIVSTKTQPSAPLDVATAFLDNLTVDDLRAIIAKKTNTSATPNPPSVNHMHENINTVMPMPPTSTPNVHFLPPAPVIDSTLPPDTALVSSSAVARGAGMAPGHQPTVLSGQHAAQLANLMDFRHQSNRLKYNFGEEHPLVFGSASRASSENCNPSPNPTILTSGPSWKWRISFFWSWVSMTRW